MTTHTSTDTQWTGVNIVTPPNRGDNRLARIATALGLDGGPLPNVDEETLCRYYDYLCEHLTLPFTAHSPAPTNREEETEFRCTVVELLPPSEYLDELIDGILCKTRKGAYEINLPLIELEIADGGPNFELIDDFWYWLWNWQ